jgi:hypothetical protein
MPNRMNTTEPTPTIRLKDRIKEARAAITIRPEPAARIRPEFLRRQAERWEKTAARWEAEKQRTLRELLSIDCPTTGPAREKDIDLTEHIEKAMTKAAEAAGQAKAYRFLVNRYTRNRPPTPA